MALTRPTVGASVGSGALLRRSGAWVGYASAGASVGSATTVAWLLRDALALPDLVMLYLMAIMAVAGVFHRGPAILSAALSVAAYDFFFIPPQFTFAIHEARHGLTFVMMFIVGTVMSAVTARIREQEQRARARERRISALYELIRQLSACQTPNQVAERAAMSMAEIFRAGVGICWPRADGQLELAGAGGELSIDDHALAVAQRCFAKLPSEEVSEGAASAALWCLPLAATRGPLGAIFVKASGEKTALDSEQRPLFESLARQVTLVLERMTYEKAAEAALLRAREEEMRSALLSAVSHDLRTPLASIRGSATALEEALTAAPSAQRELAATIAEESDRLGRIVTNIVEMTRLESGAIRLKREWVPLEELVGSALAALDERLAERVVHCDLPADPLLVYVDPVLFEQVVVNLVENAVKHTPERAHIDIFARSGASELELTVADRGPGLDAEETVRVFEKFYRGARANHSGSGLGLAICKAIANAHGGSITAKNRSGGGAEFRLVLPLPIAPDLCATPSEAS